MREMFRQQMGLDQPTIIQIARFFGRVSTGDLGTDVLTNRPVLLTVAEQMPFTLSLIATSIGWSALLGIPLGCFAAVYRGSLADRVVGVLSVSSIALPSFVVAVYGLLLFSVRLGWFPTIGAGDRGAPLDQLHHLALPSLAVGLGWVGYLARMVRASMLEVLGENHIRMARAFGLSERIITYKYALRIAIIPTVVLLGMGVGNMISSAVFAEIVFARPGVGRLIFDAVITRNYPVVMGAVMITTGFYVLCTLIADLIAAGLDPRVRSAL
jgi:peptide/nickel transport system permease protein